jgi:hypothetical protein
MNIHKDKKIKYNFFFIGLEFGFLLLLRSEEVTDRQNQNERGFEELMK